MCGIRGRKLSIKSIIKRNESHFYKKCSNKQGYVTEINHEWAVLQVYGILPSPVLGYVKKGAQLWSILLFNDDFVL